jgi:hypothetical protein
MRAGLSGEIVNVLETYELINRIMGRTEIAGVQVVSGGVLGRRGDVVVDSITNPTRIIGIADGKGQLLPDEKRTFYNEELKKVKTELAKRKFL